jgi:hypothetical protein
MSVVTDRVCMPVLTAIRDLESGRMSAGCPVAEKPALSQWNRPITARVSMVSARMAPVSVKVP